MVKIPPRPLLPSADFKDCIPFQRAGLSGREAHEGSAEIRERVNRARKVQQQRFTGEHVYSNAQMTPRLIRKHCLLSQSSQTLLERAINKYGLSARAYDRILKVSRTIADLTGVERIADEHISEAVQYRTLDRNFWQ